MIEKENREQHNYIPKTNEEVDRFMRDNELLVHAAVKPYRSFAEYEDLMQEAYMGFMSGIKNYKYNAETSLVTYCFKCMQNQLRMFIRKNSAKYRTSKVCSFNDVFAPKTQDGIHSVEGPSYAFSSDSDLLHRQESIEDQVETNALISELYDKAKALLTPAEYKAFCLHYKQGLRQVDIAEIIGTSQATASKHINTAVAKLRDAYKDVG